MERICFHREQILSINSSPFDEKGSKKKKYLDVRVISLIEYQFTLSLFCF